VVRCWWLPLTDFAPFKFLGDPRPVFLEIVVLAHFLSQDHESQVDQILNQVGVGIAGDTDV